MSVLVSGSDFKPCAQTTWHRVFSSFSESFFFLSSFFFPPPGPHGACRRQQRDRQLVRVVSRPGRPSRLIHVWGMSRAVVASYRRRVQAEPLRGCTDERERAAGTLLEHGCVFLFSIITSSRIHLTRRYNEGDTQKFNPPITFWGQFDPIQCLTSLKKIRIFFATYFMSFPHLLGTTG